MEHMAEDPQCGKLSNGYGDDGDSGGDESDDTYGKGTTLI